MISFIVFNFRVMKYYIVFWLMVTKQVYSTPDEDVIENGKYTVYVYSICRLFLINLGKKVFNFFILS